MNTCCMPGTQQIQQGTRQVRKNLLCWAPSAGEIYILAVNYFPFFGGGVGHSLSILYFCAVCCAHSLSQDQLFGTPGTIACQAPLSMGFPRQEYWNGLLFLIPGDLPNPGIEPMSPASLALAAGFFNTMPPGESMLSVLFGFLLEKCLVILPVE